MTSIKKQLEQNHPEPVEISELERKILEALQQNGKASLRNLSEITGSSVTAVKNHVDRLTELGVIKDYIAVVDCCLIGYNEMLVITLRINTSVSIEEILENLNEIDSINSIYQISGQYPILCMAKCVSKEQQMQLLERIKRIQGVEEAITQVVMRRIKEDYRVKIP